MGAIQLGNLPAQRILEDTIIPPVSADFLGLTGHRPQAVIAPGDTSVLERVAGVG
jgi:hypothetical protein